MSRRATATPGSGLLSFSHLNLAGPRRRLSSPGIRGDLSFPRRRFAGWGIPRQPSGEFPLVSPAMRWRHMRGKRGDKLPLVATAHRRGYRPLADGPPPRDSPGKFHRRATAAPALPQRLGRRLARPRRRAGPRDSCLAQRSTQATAWARCRGPGGEVTFFEYTPLIYSICRTTAGSELIWGQPRMRKARCPA